MTGVNIVFVICSGQRVVGLAAPGEGNLDRELRQVRRGRPQSRGSHLRVDVPPTVDGFPILICSGSGARGPTACQRLRVAAVGHPDPVQDVLLHEFRKGLAGHVDHQLLLDGDAAAGIALRRPWHGIHANRRRVRRLLPVEDLRDRGQWGAHVVAGKPVNGETRRVGHQAAQRDFFGLREFVLRHFPRLQRLIDVLVERQFPGLYQGQGAGRRHRLADGAGLKQRPDSDRRVRTGISHAVSLGPGDLASCR